jgi:DNA-binding CsgD family transcriptional regulator
MARRLEGRDLKPAPPAGCPLTAHQFECVALLATGLTSKQIAAQTGRTPSAIRSHLHSAYVKLDCSGGAQAVATMFGAGWLDPVSTRFGDERSTPAQSLYLGAFDRLLALRHTDAAALYIAASREMTHQLRAMYYEVHKLPPWEVLGAPRPPGRGGQRPTLTGKRTPH